MASEPIFMSDGEVDPISHMHLPRVTRQVDEGEWVAMPHVTVVVAIVGTGVTILMGWAAWELCCWAWRLFS